VTAKIETQSAPEGVFRCLTKINGFVLQNALHSSVELNVVLTLSESALQNPGSEGKETSAVGLILFHHVANNSCDASGDPRVACKFDDECTAQGFELAEMHRFFYSRSRNLIPSLLPCRQRADW